MSHTPGPYYGEGQTIFKDVRDKRWPIAEIAWWGEETPYNANLIAAAPEMLETLEMISRWFKNNSQIQKPLRYEEIEKVIKKAKGE